MGTSNVITHPAGISKTIFAISLVIVAIVAGLGGYFARGYFTSSPASVTLNGAGATFPYPFLSTVAYNYSKAHSNVQINYNAQGSSFGRSQLIAKTVDFAASDAPLSAGEMQQASNSLHIPETIGAIAVAYDLVQGKGTIPAGLNLTSQVIAKIFQGNITAWNDPQIGLLNPGATLPNQSIKMVHRSDGSGTTFVFTRYLTLYSQNVWVLGNSSSLGSKWPSSSIGGNGNQGVAGVVIGNAFTIGYVELNYAIQNNMKVANVRTNPSSGNFVKPTLQNSIYAVNNASATLTLPAGNGSWGAVNLLNATGTFSYPIVTFTYVLVYKELNVISGMTNDKAKALADFLWYIVHDGQTTAATLYYVPLPNSVIAIDETSIKSMTFNGATLHS